MRGISQWLIILWLGLLGCYRDGLKPAPDPVSAVASGTGEFCTLNPEDLEYPVKVLFVLDNSGSMRTSDPEKLRVDAVAEVARAYVPQGGFYFAVSTFGEDMKVHTPPEEPFSDDLTVIEEALNSMPEPNGSTNYHAALSQTYALIQQDILQHPKEAPRTSYVVMYMSDGQPTDGLGEAAYISIVDKIRRIQDQPSPNGCLRSTFNTAWLMNGGSAGSPLEVLLQNMAIAGSGSYQRFENSSQIDFSDIDLSFARRTYSLWNLVVSNVNAMPTPTGIGADSDADGLLDEEELSLGTDPLLVDSDGDGCRDSIEVQLGWPALQAPDPTDLDHCICDDEQRVLDTDGDGLTDCEEQFTMTSGTDVDSDYDGFIDSLELAFGLRPILDDVNRDEDLDEVLNGQEVRIHRDPRNDDIEAHEMFAYEYETRLKEELANGIQCYDIEVNNVSVLPLYGSSESINTVEIIVAQTPSDQPGDEVMFSSAIIELEVVGAPGSDLAESVTPQDFTFDTSDFQVLGQGF